MAQFYQYSGKIFFQWNPKSPTNKLRIQLERKKQKYVLIQELLMLAFCPQLRGMRGYGL